MRPVVRALYEPFSALPPASELLDLLRESVGRYCLFCEIPLGNDGRISYRVDVPNEVTDTKTKGKWRINRDVSVSAWERVLLSCGACARAKGTNPSFAEALLRYVSRLPDTDTREEGPAIEIYVEAARQWIWPDTAEDCDNQRRGWIAFPGDDTWKLLRYDIFSTTQQELAGQNLVRLTEEEQNQPWASEVQARVWVAPAADAGDAAQRVRDTIIGLNLNYSNPSDPNADRRVMARLNAWVDAEEEVRKVERFLSGLTGDEALLSRALLAHSMSPSAGMIRELVRLTGFWSIWAKLFVARIGLEPWTRFAPRAVAAFLRSILVQYEEPIRATLAMSDASHEEERKEGDANDDDDEGTFFVMVIQGTDLARLPRALGGPL